MQFSNLVLDKNHQFCVLIKPATVPVQPDKTGDESLLTMAERYFKQKLFLIHRLDRPVSGLVLMAKKKASAAYLSELFREGKVKKTYLALVENELTTSSGSFLSKINNRIPGKNKTKLNASHDEESSDAVTEYNILGKTDKYTLVSLNPLTGKHHQLRAQLSEAGCPIKGDVKYGARRANKDRSIYLHAWKLSFMHPVTNESINYEASLPEDSLWQVCQTILNERTNE